MGRKNLRIEPKDFERDNALQGFTVLRGFPGLVLCKKNIQGVKTYPKFFRTYGTRPAIEM